MLQLIFLTAELSQILTLYIFAGTILCDKMIFKCGLFLQF